MLFALVCGLLMIEVLWEIVFEYRFYFPADFTSSFLIGREPTFFGLYRAAFYVHIAVGPLTILLGAALMLTGGRPRFGTLHRLAGRSQILLVALIVPSGLVMATQAYTGGVAATGFALHSIATGLAAVATVRTAMRRRIAKHRRWATRTYILLSAPLLLRIVSGATIVAGIDNDITYQATVWGCWLIPILCYELRLSGLAPGQIRSAKGIPLEGVGE